MRLATYEDFHGAIYTEYRHHDGYKKRARLFYYFPEPILVVGCGFGFLVQEFLNLKKQAWGIDASQYCIDNRITDRVFKADVLDLSTWTLGEMGTIITEDLFPHLTDDEVLVAARNCQALAPIVIHLVTERGQADLNYHSVAQWMNLTDQPTISLEGM